VFITFDAAVNVLVEAVNVEKGAVELIV